MEPDRWREVERLYHGALEHAEGERRAFLEGACAGDTMLLQVVESLLSVHRGAEAFLEIPAVELAAPALAETVPPAERGTDILERLRTALSDRYVIERELGHGGMARVYLAEDKKHRRQVAIKVLRPDVAVAIGTGRFLREIAIAARLSHPHILPLHDSGESAGFLYYVMPYVTGESLRDRLQREHKLPLDDALQIAREVADALAQAHSLGIVHRDIKPENILFVAGHAVVSDFGIARAISLAEGDSVTGTGIVVGTPTYMSPEQATGSEHVEARSDVYSLGSVLYEMLAGEPPFSGTTAQAVLAAQVTATPKPITSLRRDTPPAVAEAIARALAKEPTTRYQAAEFRDAIAPLAATAAGRRGHPLRVALQYSLAAVAVLGVAYGLTMQLGLPTWVISGSAVLLLGGLPIMVATGLVERRRAIARAVGTNAPTSGLREWLTWRRALAGGGVAFAVLGVGTTAYMTMRLLGIGPLGTLVAAGVLKNQEPLILADFENRAADSTLGPSLTAAFRVDLGESPVVRLLDPTAIAEALRRAERPATTPLDVALARELAQREQVKAIVRGEIDPLGGGYLLAASIVAAADGRVLTAVRETAANDAGLIGAVDRLSRNLRKRIGESLKSIRAAPPLEQVSTESLNALRKYSEAARAQAAGDYERAISGFRDATAIDTGFAMAYRKLSIMLDSDSEKAAAATQAFLHRDRLPEIERYLVTGRYYETADYDWEKAVSAYRSALERDPANAYGLDNLAFRLFLRRRYREAETLLVRVMGLDSSTNHSAFTFAATFAAAAQWDQGRYDDAQATLDRLARIAGPHAPSYLLYRFVLEATRGDYALAERTLRQLRAEQRGSAEWQANCSFGLAWLDEVRGGLAQAARDLDDFMAASEQRGVAPDYVRGAIWRGLLDVRYGHHPLAGRKEVEAALAHHSLSSMPTWDRPYSSLAEFYAEAGRPEVARQLLTEYNRLVPERIRRGNPDRLAVPAAIALAEGRAQDAILLYRAWRDEADGPLQGLFELATAYERARQPDSALAVYERSIVTPGDRLEDFRGAYALTATLKRLGELYEARGDRAKALVYYGRFVDHWKGADPDLQPTVRDVRARLARVAREH
jgi:eukaryotic-like serine/threonine-protein kinase